jgi:hypothetical protein
MSSGYRFVRRFNFTAAYLPTILFAAWIAGVTLLLWSAGDRGLYSAIAAYLSCAVGLDRLLGRLCFGLSGIPGRGVALDEAYRAQLAAQLQHPLLPATVDVSALTINTVDLGEAPYFSATNLGTQTLWISTRTLRDTPREDLPYLLLMVSPYLARRGFFEPVSIMGLVWAFAAWMLARDPGAYYSGVLVLLIAIPLMVRESRGKMLRAVHDSIEGQDERDTFIAAMLRYVAGFEKTAGDLKFRRFFLRNMGFKPDEAQRLLELSVADHPAPG